MSLDAGTADRDLFAHRERTRATGLTSILAPRNQELTERWRPAMRVYPNAGRGMVIFSRRNSHFYTRMAKGAESMKLKLGRFVVEITNKQMTRILVSILLGLFSVTGSPNQFSGGAVRGDHRCGAYCTHAKEHLNRRKY